MLAAVDDPLHVVDTPDPSYKVVPDAAAPSSFYQSETCPTTDLYVC